MTRRAAVRPPGAAAHPPAVARRAAPHQPAVRPRDARRLCARHAAHRHGRSIEKAAARGVRPGRAAAQEAPQIEIPGLAAGARPRARHDRRAVRRLRADLRPRRASVDGGARGSVLPGLGGLGCVDSVGCGGSGAGCLGGFDRRVHGGGDCAGIGRIRVRFDGIRNRYRPRRPQRRQHGPLAPHRRRRRAPQQAPPRPAHPRRRRRARAGPSPRARRPQPRVRPPLRRTGPERPPCRTSSMRCGAPMRSASAAPCRACMRSNTRRCRTMTKHGAARSRWSGSSSDWRPR